MVRMFRRGSVPGLLCAVIMLASCSFTNQVGSTGILTTKAAQRAVVVKIGAKKGKDEFCAEPSPDVAQEILAAFAANANVSKPAGNTVDAGLLALSSVEMMKLFERTNGAQMFRDGLFALCNANLNDLMDSYAVTARAEENKEESVSGSESVKFKVIKPEALVYHHLYETLLATSANLALAEIVIKNSAPEDKNNDKFKAQVLKMLQCQMKTDEESRQACLTAIDDELTSLLQNLAL